MKINFFAIFSTTHFMMIPDIKTKIDITQPTTQMIWKRVSTKLLFPLFVFTLFFIGFPIESVGQAKAPIKIGDPLYTVYKDVSLQKKPSALSDFILTLSEAGTKVIFLGASSENPRWQKVKVTSPSAEGFIAIEELRPDDPTRLPQVLIKDKASGGLKATSLTVIATAATRAFTDLVPGAQEYVRQIQINEDHVFQVLAKLTKLEHSIPLDEVQKRNQSVGLFPFPATRLSGGMKKQP